jgi:uncharacterized membrane protein YfcA
LPAAEIFAVLAAGLAAGLINAVVGSGSLITFPVLLAFGVPPVVANVSNNIGLVPGNAAGVFGYRRHLAGQRGRLLRLGAASAAGAAAGAALLLLLPASAFRLIVPGLILLACALVIVQPRLSAWVKAHSGEARPHGGPALIGGVFATGVYGGYFGAAQGVILFGLLGVFIADDVQRLNATKNVLQTTANGVAAVIFVLVATVDWRMVLLIAAGSTVGGLIGARIGQRLRPGIFRAVVVAIGVIAAVKLIAFPG